MVSKPVLSQADQVEIARATREAEAATSGEIVTMVARQSDHYLAETLGFSLIVSFTAGWLIYFMRPGFGFDEISALQSLVFMMVAVVAETGGLSARFSPLEQRRHRVRASALKHFFNYGLHATAHRATILIFISLKEKCVEIISDAEATRKIPQTAWDELALEIAAGMRVRSTVEVLQNAICESGRLLQDHFPTSRADANLHADEAVLIGDR